MKLAIRAPNWVGDLVMATPVLEAALASGTFESVSIVVRAHLAKILAGGPCEPFVERIDKDSNERAVYARVAPDAVLLLTNSLGSAWRAFASRVPVRAGTALSGRRVLLTHAVVPPTSGGRRLPVPSAHLMRDAAGLLGIEVPDLHPRLYVGDATVQATRAQLVRLGIDLERGYVICCPGAAFGAAKLWPPEHFAAALDRICDELGVSAVVTGGPGEEPLMDAVVERATSNVVSLAREERNLESLKALVKDARLMLVGDSGPRWYAAAFDVPCVSVMGPNFPEVTATSLERCTVVRVEHLECAPCLQKRCPLEHHRCMRDLAPERVVAAALALLGCSPVHA
jgi:heptosyltransferase-2